MDGPAFSVYFVLLFFFAISVVFFPGFWVFCTALCVGVFFISLCFVVWGFFFCVCVVPLTPVIPTPPPFAARGLPDPRPGRGAVSAAGGAAAVDHGCGPCAARPAFVGGRRRRRGPTPQPLPRRRCAVRGNTNVYFCSFSCLSIFSELTKCAFLCILGVFVHFFKTFLEVFLYFFHPQQLFYLSWK